MRPFGFGPLGDLDSGLGVSRSRAKEGEHEVTIGVPKREQRRRLGVLLRGPHVLRQRGDVHVVVFNTL